MKLEFAKNLRELRLRRDLTQDELAEQLGVSVQTVSRWESSTKTSYPDIELLPTIAGFFGVTVDELLGCSKAQSDERLARYWEEVNALNSINNTKEKIDLLRQMHEEWPENIEIMRMLCLLGTYLSDVENHPEYSGFICSVAKKLLAISTSKNHRVIATEALILLETEDLIDETVENYCLDHDTYALLERRYNLDRREENDMYYEFRQRNSFAGIMEFFGKSGYYGRETRYSSLEYRIWQKETILQIMNILSGCSSSDLMGDGELDLWAARRVSYAILLAGDLYKTGEHERAHEIADIATTLAEKFCLLPQGTILTFRCPAFSTIKGELVYVKFSGGISIGAHIIINGQRNFHSILPRHLVRMFERYGDVFADNIKRLLAVDESLEKLYSESQEKNATNFPKPIDKAYHI